MYNNQTFSEEKYGVPVCFIWYTASVLRQTEGKLGKSQSASFDYRESTAIYLSKVRLVRQRNQSQTVSAHSYTLFRAGGYSFSLPRQNVRQQEESIILVDISIVGWNLPNIQSMIDQDPFGHSVYCFLKTSFAGID